MTDCAVVLGGTFDPVHLAHLDMAAQARDAIGAAEAWLVPARAPALRPEPVAPAALRLEMLRAAARGVAGVRVLDVEMERDGPSYTADTLEALAEQRPHCELWWLVGSDAIRRVRDWWRAEDLLRSARFAIVQREGTARYTPGEAEAAGLDAGRTRILEITPPRISATQVRTRAAACESLDGLVPPAVAEIIERTGVYRGAAVMR